MRHLLTSRFRRHEMLYPPTLANGFSETSRIKPRQTNTIMGQCMIMSWKLFPAEVSSSFVSELELFFTARVNALAT